jgi:hypothetical protein
VVITGAVFGNARQPQEAFIFEWLKGLLVFKVNLLATLADLVEQFQLGVKERAGNFTGDIGAPDIHPSVLIH